MKIIVSSVVLFHVCLVCLFGRSKAESEVYGTFDMIDGYNHGFNKNLFESHEKPHKTVDAVSKQVAIEMSPSSTPSSTQSSATTQKPAQRLFPTISYNQSLARRLGLSTIMMSGVLYGISMIPALIAITGAGPLSGFLSHLGRRKRSLVNESHIFRQLPLLNNEETYKFLSLFESTLTSRKIENSNCKRYYTCKVYHKVLKSGENPPTLATFENAILDVFGIAVERKDFKFYLIPTVKMYYNVAKDAIRGEICARRYPCSPQAHNTSHTNYHFFT